MTARPSTSRSSSEDFETASIRSAAPSYVSNAPSYHSTVVYGEAAPAYAPPVPPNPRPMTTSGHTASQIIAPSPQRSTNGLPPVPLAPPQSVLSINNFRIPMWPTTDALATRHYRRIAERRVNQSTMEQSPRRHGSVTQDQTIDPASELSTSSTIRPLEDPYLVGEEAAAEARRERLAREIDDDVLQREDRQWDWLLAQMRDWDERERKRNRFRQEIDQGRKKKLLRRIGGKLL